MEKNNQCIKIPWCSGFKMHLIFNPEKGNQTVAAAFILLDFNIEDLHMLYFMLFLTIYLATITGNILIVILVVIDQHLHTPMYFFLGNLSCLETCYSSTIMPRMLVSFLTGNKSISIPGCFAQLYFFGFLAATECYFLAVMSYDRYLAICRPLHYTMLMNGKICTLLIGGSWITGSLGISTIIFLVSQLTFCGPNKINHFFCDFMPVVRLSCSETHSVQMAAFILSSIGTLPPLLITLTSYICIIKNILRIPSTTGKQKAFSTCSSHLTVVSCFYGSLMIVYVLPEMSSLSEIKKLFSLFYTLLTPLVNPLIYSLRNKEVKEGIKKTFKMLCKSH
ncbi:olfactory receptor 2AP1-like [Hemicordylus capensis]|uniref:olfactory receptor 2AP1-like n=1 Tax=Hemicordylus capensis TaxID=884348 RepID=UPI0023039113|nr:olfactory receptor 2AP1-like [Hemicordylus capensis]XP_053114932.1 olfactory receptor 2AP1-like [Hemicordylus capensis]XP_053114933.1 olfactory receptor 2AP1-like [Hemicordylus capensis]